MADNDEGPVHFSSGIVNNPTADTTCGEVVPSYLATHDYPEEVDCPVCRETPAFKVRQAEMDNFCETNHAVPPGCAANGVKKMARNKSRPVYSGNASKTFWRRINALPEPHGEYLYAMAARLQDMESTVLNLLAEAEVQTILRQAVQKKRASKLVSKRRRP